MQSELNPPLGDTGKNHGWVVTFSAMGINLALGVLYSWSVIGKSIPKEWGWNEADRSWPYSIACLIFSLIMIPAGRMQDRIGPRWVATAGGLLVGLGMILAGLTTSPIGYIVGFGVLAGTGIGCGYASATPPAVKWFPPARTGLIAGLVVSGFGLASVYIAPLAKALIGSVGLPNTMIILGIGFLVVVTALSQLLQAPPRPLQFAKPAGTGAGATPSAGAVKKVDFTPREVLRTWQFYVLWFMYACGAGAGLMIISKLATIASDQAGMALGFLLVAVLAIGNGAGRIAAGMLSDRIGRKATLFLCFVVQAVLIAVLSQTKAGGFLAGTWVLAIMSALIGANYGANLALFPSLTKDYYGLKNFGVNYGLVFTAWGFGGFALSLLAGWVYDTSNPKTFAFAYGCSVVLLVLAAAVTFLVKPPHRAADPAAAPGAEKGQA